MMRFEVVDVWDLPSRKALLVSVRVHGGETVLGTPLRDESTQLVWQLAGRQFPSRMELERGTTTILLGRTGAEPPAPGTHLVG